MMPDLMSVLMSAFDKHLLLQFAFGKDQQAWLDEVKLQLAPLSSGRRYFNYVDRWVSVRL